MRTILTLVLVYLIQLFAGIMAILAALSIVGLGSYGTYACVRVVFQYARKLEHKAYSYSLKALACLLAIKLISETAYGLNLLLSSLIRAILY